MPRFCWCLQTTIYLNKVHTATQFCVQLRPIYTRGQKCGTIQFFYHFSNIFQWIWIIFTLNVAIDSVNDDIKFQLNTLDRKKLMVESIFFLKITVPKMWDNFRKILFKGSLKPVYPHFSLWHLFVYILAGYIIAMAPRMTVSLKRRIVQLYEDKNFIRKIAEDLHLSKGVVGRIIKD